MLKHVCIIITQKTEKAYIPGFTKFFVGSNAALSFFSQIESSGLEKCGNKRTDHEMPKVLESFVVPVHTPDTMMHLKKN